jgi:PEP-CTERM motif
MNTTYTIFPTKRPAETRWALVLAMCSVGFAAPAFAHDHTWREAVGSIDASSLGASFEMLSRQSGGLEGAMHDGRSSIALPSASDRDTVVDMPWHDLEAEHGQWRGLSLELEHEYHHHHPPPAVPEPATWAGMVLGLGALAVVRRVRRKRDR